MIRNNFLQFINNKYNFDRVTNYYLNYFDFVEKSILSNKFIPINIKEYLNNFPIFDNYTRLITDISIYDLNKIRTSVEDNLESILLNIDDSVLSLKRNIDTIDKNSIEKIKFQLGCQYIWSSDTSDFFNLRKDLLNYKNIDEFTNYINYIIGDNYYSSENIDFFHLYFLFIFSINNSLSTTNITSQIYDYCLSSNFLSKQNVKNNFSNFINDNFSVYKDILTSLLLKNNYSIINPNYNLKLNTDNIIMESSSVLVDEFSNFIDNSSYDFTNLFIKTYFNLYKHLKSLDIINNTDFSNIVNDKEISSPTSILNLLSHIDNFVRNIDKYNSKSYFYLLYYYKFYPYKFLSIIQYIFTRFIKEKIFDIEYFNFITPTSVKSSLKSYFSNDIIIDNYINNIKNKFNDDNKLNNESLLNYTTFITFNSVFDDFIESKYFDNYIKYLFKKSFDNMVEERYLDRDENWFKNYHIFKLLFKTIFKKSLMDGSIFTDQLNLLKTIVNDINIQNLKEYSEILTESATRLTTFYTTYKFEDSSLSVFIDEEEVSTDNFIIDGNSHKLILDVPYNNSKISVTYNIYYEISTYDVDFNIKLQRFFNDESISKMITTFLKNMIMSSTTKEFIYNILGYYLLE